MRRPPTCGVYALVNETNGKVYVGSSKDVRYRVARHRGELLRRAHSNLHLQSSYNLGHTFRDVVLEECAEGSLVEREQFYIDLHQSLSPDKGYNLTPAGRTIISPEGRKRIGDAHRGKTLEELWGVERAATRREELKLQVGEANPNFGNRGASNPRTGRTDLEVFGPEEAARRSARTREVHLGKRLSPETKELISQSHKGKTLTDDHRKAIGEGLSRFAQSVGPRTFEDIHGDSADAVRAKISASLSGRPFKARKPPRACARCAGPTPHRKREYCPECSTIVRSEAMKGNSRGAKTKPLALPDLTSLPKEV